MRDREQACCWRIGKPRGLGTSLVVIQSQVGWDGLVINEAGWDGLVWNKIYGDGLAFNKVGRRNYFSKLNEYGHVKLTFKLKYFDKLNIYYTSSLPAMWLLPSEVQLSASHFFFEKNRNLNKFI